ncbi:unnamed protein product [Calypogeia fissa]
MNGTGYGRRNYGEE